MKDIDQIRRDNMLIIEKEMGSTTIAANAIGMTLTQFINLRDGAKDSKTGVPRGMRKTTAWKIEDGARKERGWLDKDHSGDQRTNAKALSENMFNLTCPKCLKHTRKSFVELELYNEIACQCGNPIRVSDQYPTSVLETILKSLCGDGFTLRKRDEI